MSRIEATIDVEAPIKEVYDQWTQFEDFPEFMDGVKHVVQRSDQTLDWTAEVGGQERSWTATIVDQTPDTRIAWRSTSGARNDGAVLFDAIAPRTTRVTLKLDAEPDGVVESVGDALGFLERRAKGDLERFKAFIERRQVATGAWRGEIHGEEVKSEAR